MIVVDASALVEVLLQKPAAAILRARLFSAGQSLHAPHLINIEVAQVIRRHVMNGEADAARGLLALNYLPMMRITLYPHGPLLARAWALRHNLTAYDAAYVALAEMLDAPLITLDRRLANAAGHDVRVDLV